VTASDIDRDLRRLEAELRQLEAEYAMFFSGRAPTPPWETRGRVEALVRQYDRAHIANFGDRFRFTTLQSRFTVHAELWDRGLRAREEGRPGPFAWRAPATEPPTPHHEDRIVHVACLRDPLVEFDKLTELYDSLSEARREAGEKPVPFPRFAALVKQQVARLGHAGSDEVAFRVALKNGKVSFTARPLKGARD